MANPEWASIDLRKFSQAPQNGYVLRLLVLLNDIDSIVYLSKRLDEHQSELRSFIEWKWFDGVRLFLLRNNLATLADGMHDTINRMCCQVAKARLQRDCNQNPPQTLWQLIAKNEELLNALIDLSQIISAEDFYKAFKGVRFVRDKLTAHLDVRVLSRSMRQLHTTGEREDGLVILDQGINSYRGLLADDVVSYAWQCEGIEVPVALSHQINEGNHKPLVRYTTFINEIREKVSVFAFNLFDEYVVTYNLQSSKEKHDEIQQELEQWTSNQHE